MNEKLQYATMLEIPVSTCNVTFKPIKKKNKKRKKEVNPEAVKQQLMNKINAEEQPATQETAEFNYVDTESVYQNEVVNEENASVDSDPPATVNIISAKERRKREKGRFSVIGVQLAVIGVLIATIFLTNAFYQDSGINVFMREVFGGGATVEATDERTYDKFSPVLALSDTVGVSLEQGVINFNGTGSVYSPCNGKVTAVTQTADGKFSIEIAHSENFTTLLSGLDYAYADIEQTVYYNIPVGYIRGEGASMCFKGADGTVISDYQIIDNSVVWAV